MEGRLVDGGAFEHNFSSKTDFNSIVSFTIGGERKEEEEKVSHSVDEVFCPPNNQPLSHYSSTFLPSSQKAFN